MEIQVQKLQSGDACRKDKKASKENGNMVALTLAQENYTDTGCVLDWRRSVSSVRKKDTFTR